MSPLQVTLDALRQRTIANHRDALASDFEARSRDIHTEIAGIIPKSQFLKNALRAHAAECDKLARWIREGR